MRAARRLDAAPDPPESPARRDPVSIELDALRVVLDQLGDVDGRLGRAAAVRVLTHAGQWLHTGGASAVGS